MCWAANLHEAVACHTLSLLNVKSATHPDRDKQANVRDPNDIAKHTNVKSMLTPDHPELHQEL